MKKTFFPLLALTGVASAATLNLTKSDILLSAAIANSGYTADQISEITFTDGVAITIDQAINVETLRFADNEVIKNVTFNFTWDGCISTSDKVWLTDSNNNQVQSVIFGLIVEDDELDDFVTTMTSNPTYEKTLLDTTKTWEVEQVFRNNKVKLTLSNNLRDMGYTVATSYVNNAEGLSAGEIGIGQSGWNKPVKLQMRAIPEPTTATLSLLALVGLAARRRRK